jgi:acetyl-CoA carboxylase biotin carboxylase subunit
MFTKILVANRGEIAINIIRSAHELGIATVAIYSEADKHSLHVQLADEAICVGDNLPKNSYLNMPNILMAALETGCEAIHPGFGFLSENSEFVARCEECNIKFIGPDKETIKKMGNKSMARDMMVAAGVPVIPGSKGSILDVEEGLEIVEEIGYPVFIKASAGGGGRGMRLAHNEDEFRRGYTQAKMEAKTAFGDDTLYLEKCVVNPKHIEVQILGDNFGKVIHLGERDCSMQRRNQKMLEESPGVTVSEEVRKKLCETAVRAAEYADYTNAGTIEFLMDKYGEFYFIEMNTRIQVEHPVTEMVTGIDLIKEQIKIAAGEPIAYSQEDIKTTGHAIECRINMEDPDNKFMPTPGEIKLLHIPGGKGVRVDTSVYQGYVMTPYYDSMVGKLIVHGVDRNNAIAKMKQALHEFIVEGDIKTNIDFQYQLISHPEFLSGEYDTGFIGREFKDLL